MEMTKAQAIRMLAVYIEDGAIQYEGGRDIILPYIQSQNHPIIRYTAVESLWQIARYKDDIIVSALKKALTTENITLILETIKHVISILE